MYDQVWLEHIRVLAEEIGPRGSTTASERQGAEYCFRALAGLGLGPEIEPFTRARSIFQPHLIAAGALLVSFALYPLAGRASAGPAALLALLALVSDVLELSFVNNPLRWIVSKGPSQNVVAVVPASYEHRQDLVLIGHLDTQRTPLIFA